MNTSNLPFRTIVHILLLFSLYPPASCVFQFNQQGEFTILQLTDQHYCETADRDRATQNLTRTLLNWTQPDLVVFSGDAASGYTPGSYYHGFFYSCWEKFTQPVMEYDIPYAYILGNHDAEGDLNREEIVQLDQTNPLSVRSECEGIPNKSTFYVPIYSSKNQSQLAANIWMFDSGSYGCNSYDNSWGCIDEAQLDWYDQESKKLKEQYREDVHHIAFLHIPIPEYLQIYNFGAIYGTSDEPVSCPTINSGFFEHVLVNGDITAMFLGHDHWNDFGGWYNGVELVYGRKSGYGGYGDIRGARVIKFKEEISEEGKVTVTRDHYVIYENGTIGYTHPVSHRPDNKEDHCPKLHVNEKSSLSGIAGACVAFILLSMVILRRFI